MWNNFSFVRSFGSRDTRVFLYVHITFMYFFCFAFFFLFYFIFGFVSDGTMHIEFRSLCYTYIYICMHIVPHIITCSRVRVYAYLESSLNISSVALTHSTQHTTHIIFQCNFIDWQKKWNSFYQRSINNNYNKTEQKKKKKNRRNVIWLKCV